MAINDEKLLTLNEVADLFRVSRHTVQAWISPSSPNHRPEFAAMARHAGRKTLFVENEVKAWLDQRRGPVYAIGASERSPYWRERFVAGRGLLKGLIKVSEHNPGFMPFQGGLLGLDTEPVLVWLADGPGAAALYNLILRAEGLVMPVPLLAWIMRRTSRFTRKVRLMTDFMLDQNIFELAPFHEDAVRRLVAMPSGINEQTLQNYSCCMAAGVSAFLSGEKNLLKVPGLPVISF